MGILLHELGRNQRRQPGRVNLGTNKLWYDFSFNILSIFARKTIYIPIQHFFMNLQTIRSLVFLSLLSCPAFAQETKKPETTTTISMPASGKYHKGNLYRRLWGEHYRKEWHTPVQFFKTNLDTLAGGLVPYEAGGGRQTQNLRLKDINDREYVLRSVDKNLGKALPEILRGTFMEKFANDQVTFAHPYGALIIAPLAEAAGIYHAKPAIYFVPEQPALKSFNDSAGNTLYLFEQRPDENWSTSSNFGYSKKIIGTEKLLEETLEDNDKSIDQEAYVRARLFDMIIGDWAKHEDQWRWASFKKENKTLYIPIPRDRDNAFSKFDGSLLKVAKGMAGATHLHDYTAALPDPVSFNYPARYLDHHLVNALTLEQWVAIANDLKSKITDGIITDAVKRLPPEVYDLSGPRLAANIKSRKNSLDTYAKNYYMYLSKEVEITGSKKNELVEIKNISPAETEIKISKINAEGQVPEAPYFSRVFNNNETKEVRIYGMDGKDRYVFSGDESKGPTVRLIGGPGKDQYQGAANASSNIHIYDNAENDTEQSRNAKLHLSNDTAIHAYKYDYFKADKKGISPILFYSNEDRIYVGLGYKIRTQKWRKEPFGTQHKLAARYSFAQKAFSASSESVFTQLIGKWDLNIFADYDQVRWTNFFGLGNESALTTKERDFNRVRTQQFIGKIGVQRVFNGKQRITFNPFFQSYDIINDTNRYLAKYPVLPGPETYKARMFAGAELEYLYQNINDSVLPTKGFNLLSFANFSQNLQSGKNVTRFGAQANLFVPLSRKLGLSVKAGGASLTGEPEFYQYNVVGGTETLRGHQRDRFYGKSTVYNQNELRWISDVRSNLYNGKLGFFGFYDMGRVWLPGESSKTLHNGYGAGLLLVPFNKIALSVAYGMSKEDNNIHIRIKKAL